MFDGRRFFDFHTIFLISPLQGQWIIV